MPLRGDVRCLQIVDRPRSFEFAGQRLNESGEDEMFVERLIGVLERLNEIHEKLLELAERKRQALIRNDVQEVSAATAAENQLIKSVEQLLAEKREATNDFFRSRGFQPVREVTVTELSRLVTDSAMKEALLAARDRLSATAERLRQKNELNQQLLEQSLDFINYSLDVLIGPDDDPMYQNPMDKRKPGIQRTGYFDSKA